MLSSPGNGTRTKSRGTDAPSPSTILSVFITSEWVLARSVVAADSKIDFTSESPRTDSLSTWRKRSANRPLAIWLDRNAPAPSSARAESSTVDATVRNSSERRQRVATERIP